MNSDIIIENEFKFLALGKSERPVLMLLHGLMGSLSNFNSIINEFKDQYRVIVPLLPIFDLPLRRTSIDGLLEYLEKFIEYKELKKINLLGNSLGGHLCQLYTLKNPNKVNTMILTGSSGLFESAFGKTFPKRGNYKYIKEKTQSVFYNPKFASKTLVDDIFETVNNRNKALRIVKTAKSAVRHNLGNLLHNIKTPVLLIWGMQDKVTPPFVGKKFEELLPNSTLVYMDECGHAPMMEKPKEFNKVLKKFLQEKNGKQLVQ